MQTEDGEFYLVKSDILNGKMTFSSSRDMMSNVTVLPIDRVKEIMEINRSGKRVEQLLREEDMPKSVEEPTYRSEEDSITRFDSAKPRRKSKNRKPNNKGQERRTDNKEQPREAKEGANNNRNNRPRKFNNRKENKESKE